MTTFGKSVFDRCKALKAVVLRSELGVCTASSDPLISNQSGGVCYIYVPSALIEQYKVATNWTVYASQFRVLEDYTVDGTITGALDESKI